MIIYGVLGDVSILKLFTAGFIPGFLLAGCFMAWVMIHATLRPALVPASRARAAAACRCIDRIRALKELAPAIFLIARGARLDVWRHRDAVGERRGRRARRASSWRRCRAG